jgi:iron complex outermembrane receptor protein
MTVRMALALAAAATAAAGAAWADPPASVGEVVVVAPAPLPGGMIDPDKLPGAVRVLSGAALGASAHTGLADALSGRSAAIHVSDEQGSTFRPDVEFRGFDASPILGAAGGEGLAVYQNGVRQNEAFGDLVDWDLSPSFAVDKITLMGADPVFGLNAVGGALSLTMKDGFTAPGGALELSGGSFGRATGTLQYGASHGGFGLYVGMNATGDQGYRDHSPARLRQLYADLGWRGDRASVHLSLQGADNTLSAVGAAPVQMLAIDRRAAFSFPQTVRDRLAAVTLSASYAASPVLDLAADLYGRRFRQSTLDGNTTDISNEGCANPADNPDGAFLCLGSSRNTVYDRRGAPVPDFLGPAMAAGADVAYGQLDRTSTISDSVGGALQATATAKLFGRPNHLVVGVAVDHGRTRFATTSELGSMDGRLHVVGAGYVIDQAASPQAASQALAAGAFIAPVDLVATNTYAGVYFSDALDLTARLTATVAGRYNWAALDLDDRIGTSLNGSHRYDRFNPAIGATYRIAPGLSAYAGYAESNRNPTPAELACADPLRPCVLAGQLVADPPLKPVVGRTWEAGLRGRARAAPLAADLVWSLGVFRTDTDNEILDIATSAFSAGQGYFANAGAARRQGVEARASLTAARWSLGLDYSLVDATFRSRLSLPSRSPFADPVSGDITVRPGDHMPLIPAQRLVINADWSLTPRLSLGADLRVQGGAWLGGDDSNQAPRLPGWTRLDLRARYRLHPRIELFARIENVADARYATYGVFTGLDGLPPSLVLSDPRSFTPAAPRAAYVGLTANF